jgi:hypothetical protein
MRTITSGAGVLPPEYLRSLCLGLWTRGCWGSPKGIGSNSVHQHEPDLEHHRQKTVRATEPGFRGHLCVRYIRSTIMTDAVSPLSQAIRRTYASKSLCGTFAISTPTIAVASNRLCREDLYVNQEVKEGRWLKRTRKVVKPYLRKTCPLGVLLIFDIPLCESGSVIGRPLQNLLWYLS